MKTNPSTPYSNAVSLSSRVSGKKASWLVFTSLIFTLSSVAQGKADKRLVMADKYFAAGEFVTAAGLYGQYLNPAKTSKASTGFPLNNRRTAGGGMGVYENKTDILFRQATSLRMANYTSEATQLYKQCFEKDSAKYSESIYWYAVCQRGLGNYAVAEESINRFLNHPGSMQQEAEAELQTIQFIKSQITRPDTVLYHLQKLQSPLVEKAFYAPFQTEGGLIITGTSKDSAAAGENPYHNRLFQSVTSNGSIQHAEPVAIPSLDPSMNQAAATLSADGKYLYFTQWKKVDGEVISRICYSVKTAGGWGQAQLLSSVNEGGNNSKQPFCSADGKYLFFASDRAGGQGQFDIWYALLQADGTTGQPVNAGSVNTALNEQAPFYHSATGTLVFASDRMPGMGGYDLYTSKGGATQWETPMNMGYPVNSTRDDVYFFTSGKTNLLDHAYFSSDRGSGCCLETYTVAKTPKKKMFVGMVRDCSNNQPLEDVDVVLNGSAGNALKARTNSNGSFSYEWTHSEWNGLAVSKEKYYDKKAGISIKDRNESGYFADTLYQAEVCMDKKLVIKMEDVVTVYFDYDDYRLRTVVRVKLDSIYTVLAGDSTAKIQISGYSDGKGKAEYNKKLSERRAKSCADYLVKRGIDPGRIRFESFGACCPVEMELINGRDNNDARSLNRRALINISRD